MQIFYTVRSGDTLQNIAGRWDIPLTSLIYANNISAPYTIYPGQQLSMPPGVNTYAVKPDDSIYSISQRYGLPTNVIINANGIEPPYVIIPGQILVVPSGVPYYVIRPGDSLYKIALNYNVVLNGRPRPDLIINANVGRTPYILPGMTISIPYPPPGGPGILAAAFSDSIRYYMGLYDPNTGILSSIDINDLGETSNIFWSPDQTHIAAIGSTGIVYIIDVKTKRISKIDKTVLPAFIDWAPDNRRIVYSNGKVIRIYDVLSNTSTSIDRPRTLYVQWFSNGTELLYEAKDTSNISQLYRINADGSNKRQITSNSDSPLNQVRLSPNDRFVLYTTPGASISEIYTIELSSGNIYKIPGGPEAKNYFPTWSPDSTKIAYSSTHFMNGKYYSLIRVSGAKGEGDSTLAISSCYFTPLTWSPDSRIIAYMSGCRDENLPIEIWSINLGKPTPINVLSGLTLYALDWSPTR